MKKTLLALAVLAGIAYAAPVYALGDKEFHVPLDVNRNPSDNDGLFGYSVSSRTAAGVQRTNNSGPGLAEAALGKQWATGTGTLVDVVIGTAAATVYVVCTDTVSVGSGVISTEDPALVKLIEPSFANTTNAVSAQTGTTGSGPRMLPVEYMKGIWCWASVAGTPYHPVFRRTQD